MKGETKLDKIISDIEKIEKEILSKKRINFSDFEILEELKKKKETLENLKFLFSKTPISMDLGECKKHYYLIYKEIIKIDDDYQEKDFIIENINSYKEFVFKEIKEFSKKF